MLAVEQGKDSMVTLVGVFSAKVDIVKYWESFHRKIEDIASCALCSQLLALHIPFFIFQCMALPHRFLCKWKMHFLEALQSYNETSVLQN